MIRNSSGVTYRFIINSMHVLMMRSRGQLLKPAWRCHGQPDTISWLQASHHTMVTVTNLDTSRQCTCFIISISWYYNTDTVRPTLRNFARTISCQPLSGSVGQQSSPWQRTAETGIIRVQLSKSVSDLLMQPSVEKYNISNEVNKQSIIIT